VAVSRNERRNGTWTEVTDGFFKVVAWGQLGEHIASSCKKGARILVSGKLIQRNFEVEGNKRSSIEITASAVGPELKFVTAEVSKASSPDVPAAEDTRAN
jgi:single-strand DNA-binding protein